MMAKKILKQINQSNFLKTTPARDAKNTPDNSPIVKTRLFVELFVYFGV